MRQIQGVLLVLVALSATAQPLQFGALTPLTNTRYGPVEGSGVLTTNGTDAFLVTSSAGSVRIAKIVDGLPRAGRVVLPSSLDLAIVWTGNHFLLVARSSEDGSIAGRLLDRNGEPLGEPFTILGLGRRPALAWNGTTVLMLYTPERYFRPLSPVYAMRLSATGRPATTSEVVASAANDYALATNGHSFAAITASRTSVQFATFDGLGVLRSNVVRDGLPEADRDVAIASNESEYLTIWLTATGTITTCTLVPGGATTEPVALEETGLDETGAPSLVWDGSRFLLTYRTGKENTSIRVLQVDGSSSVSHEYSAQARRFTTNSAIAVEGRTYTAWTATDGTLRLRDSDDPQSEATSTVYGAAHQDFQATASSALATLFVWREWLGGQYTLHAGLRTRSGDWSERPILTNAGGNTPVIAASDGDGFMVIATDKTGRVAIRLGSDGRVLRGPVRFTRSDLYPHSIVWNGSTYILAGSRFSPTSYFITTRVFVAPVDQSGVIGEVVLMPSTSYSEYTPHLATDGATLMLAWLQVEPHCGWPWCAAQNHRVTMRRLGRSLELLDPEPIMSTDLSPEITVSGLFWTGAEYVLGWMKDSKLQLARFSANGTANGPEIALPEETGWMTGMTRSGAIVLTRIGDDYRTQTITMFDRGQVGTSTLLHVTTSGVFIPLFDDRIAWLGRPTRVEPPHHGAYRLMMMIGCPTGPPRIAGAPQLSARADGQTVTLEWTAPVGTVNGYRIEYRLAEGAWNELDRWLNASASRTDVRLPSGITRVEFRMRAWNDGGTGPYSDAVAVGVPRRRSVR